jgi:hypothetical protein
MLGVSYFADGGRWKTGPIQEIRCDTDSETYIATADLYGLEVKTEEDFIFLLKQIATRGWDTKQLSDEMLEIIKGFANEKT